eukprot:g17140.t1
MASLTDPKPLAAAMAAAAKMRQRRSSSSVNNATATLRVSISDVVNVHAKEKGMSAERLFEHFAPDGEASVTPAMFETALRKLGQRAFNLDEMELEHLVTTFDTDGNGTVELDEFMTFCLSIPSLPWRAEKARRLNNVESKDDLNVAARKVARRRSSLRAIPIGKLIHEGSRFFWRSKDTIDVAFHHNSDEGLITISTRSLERGYNYPAIFVDAAKIPVPKSEAVARANSIGQFDTMDKEERQEATAEAMTALWVEYLQHRLKVPDEVNEPGEEAEGEGGARGQAALHATESEDSLSSTSDDGKHDRKNAGGGEAVVVPSTGGGPSMVARTTKSGDMTPRQRADDKAKHRPFLVKLSTDKWDNLLCARNIVLQTPHRFEEPRKPSMADFRRASLEFELLAKETEKLSTVAERKTRKVEASIHSLAGPSSGEPRSP